MAQKIHYKTSIDIALDTIGGKWKVLIIAKLSSGVKRTGQLQKSIQGISQRMLIQQLRSLESDGIVHRKMYHQIPPKVEYNLTRHGQSLLPIINALSSWGIKHVRETFPKKSIEYKMICEPDKLRDIKGKVIKRTKAIR